MKKSLFTILILLIYSPIFAQTGSIELNTGGFSFIPAFTSREPNVIINAGTNPKKRLTGNFMYMMRVGTLTPTTVVLMTRYKFIDKKLKAVAGIHLPAFQMTKEYEVTSFFGQEMTFTYPVSSKFSGGLFLLNGRGRNSDFKAFFSALNGIYAYKKYTSISQTYYLNVNNITGIAETITYDFDKHFHLRAFGNYTFTDGSALATLGLRYNL